MKISVKKIYGRLFREYMKPYLWGYAFAAIIMGFYSLSQVIMVRYLQPLVDDAIKAGDVDMIFNISLMILIAFISRGFFSLIQTLVISRIGLRIIAQLKKDLVASIFKQDLLFYQKNNAGKIIANFTNDVYLIKASVSRAFLNIGREGSTAIGMVAFVLYMNPVLSLSVLFFLSLTGVFLHLISRKIRKAVNRNQTSLEDYNSTLHQAVEGIRVIKSYTGEESEQKKLKEKIKRIYVLSKKIVFTQSLHKPFLETLAGLSLFGLLIYGGSLVSTGQTTAGELLSFIAALMLTVQPLKSLARVNNYIQSGAVGASRVFKTMDMQPEITNQPNAVDLKAKNGSVTFKDIDFSYDIEERHFHLDKINLDIKAGEKVAIVGPSGSGKTTLINLLMRFYDLHSGQISIDGQDIKQVKIKSLRQNISLVSQDTFLFDDTIYNNIAYGISGTTEENVVQAAKDAGAYEFIMALPEQLNTVVGDKGTKLSGGQKQRISIARAFLKNAPILILDEATSALDTKAENLVQSSLEKLSKGRTTIMIAHRLSTIKIADVIIVMNQGKIVDIGHHDVLLKQSTLYKELYLKQAA